MDLCSYIHQQLRRHVCSLYGTVKRVTLDLQLRTQIGNLALRQSQLMFHDAHHALRLPLLDLWNGNCENLKGGSSYIRLY